MRNQEVLQRIKEMDPSRGGIEVDGRGKREAKKGISAKRTEASERRRINTQNTGRVVENLYLEMLFCSS